MHFALTILKKGKREKIIIYIRAREEHEERE